MHPDLISDVNVVPGISDHEAVTFKIKLSHLFIIIIGPTPSES